MNRFIKFLRQSDPATIAETYSQIEKEFTLARFGLDTRSVCELYLKVLNGKLLNEKEKERLDILHNPLG